MQDRLTFRATPEDLSFIPHLLPMIFLAFQDRFEECMCLAISLMVRYAMMSPANSPALEDSDS